MAAADVAAFSAAVLMHASVRTRLGSLIPLGS
jgi:hypothetical protein